MQSFHSYNERVGRFHTLSGLAILPLCKQRGFSQHVTTTEAQAPALWSDVILRAIVELRGLFDSMQDRLDDTGRDDFHHLFEGADRLEAMLTSSAPRLRARGGPSAKLLKNGATGRSTVRSRTAPRTRTSYSVGGSTTSGACGAGSCFFFFEKTAPAIKPPIVLNRTPKIVDLMIEKISTRKPNSGLVA